MHPSYERAPFFTPDCLDTETHVSTFLPEYKMPSLVRDGDAATWAFCWLKIIITSLHWQVLLPAVGSSRAAFAEGPQGWHPSCRGLRLSGRVGTLGELAWTGRTGTSLPAVERRLGWCGCSYEKGFQHCITTFFDKNIVAVLDTIHHLLYWISDILCWLRPHGIIKHLQMPTQQIWFIIHLTSCPDENQYTRRLAGSSAKIKSINFQFFLIPFE